MQELLERRKYHRLPHNPLHDSAEVWQREAPSAGAPLLEAWRFAGDVWEVRVMFDAQVPLSLAPKKRGNYGKEETATAWASTVIYAIPAADLMKLLPRLEEMLAAGMRAMRGVR